MPGSEKIMESMKKRFDAMSAAELKELLHQDSLLLEDECLDVEMILYISRLIERRGDSGADKFKPVDEAWKNFNDHYRSMESDGTSLYDDGTAAVELAKNTNRRRPLKSILKVACVAAALIALLFAVSLVAYAGGYDLWVTVAEWTMETFGFDLKTDKIQMDYLYEDFKEVAAVLESKEILFDVLPRWLPDGYTYKTMEVMENPMKKMLCLEYTDGEERLVELTITLRKESTSRSYEKDENLVQTYECGKVKHYILQNNEEIKIAWTVGSFECFLCGEISVEEAMKIIDSIYGG